MDKAWSVTSGRFLADRKPDGHYLPGKILCTFVEMHREMLDNPRRGFVEEKSGTGSVCRPVRLGCTREDTAAEKESFLFTKKDF